MESKSGNRMLISDGEVDHYDHVQYFHTHSCILVIPHNTSRFHEQEVMDSISVGQMIGKAGPITAGRALASFTITPASRTIF